MNDGGVRGIQETEEPAQEEPAQEESEAAVAKADWKEILGPKQGERPKPRTHFEWLRDLERARLVAMRENRPIFAVLRCRERNDIGEFVDQVESPDRALEKLMRQFITVRLTSIQGLDQRLFPFEGYQDLDVTWWAWFFSPRGELYGVYGGRDHLGAGNRLSIQDLKLTLSRILNHHYDPRRESWGIDGPEYIPDDAPQTMFRLPGWSSWFEKFGGIDEARCIRCHEVAQILRQPAIDAGEFDKRRDLAVWPLPEGLGLRLAVRDGLLVRAVETGSAADRAGLQTGDMLLAAGERRLFSEADFRGVLHRLPANEAWVQVHWKRGGVIQSGVVRFEQGWRAGMSFWRPSILDGNVGAHPGFFPPTNVDPQERVQLGLEDKVLAVRPVFNRYTSLVGQQAGLREQDVIVAVNGSKPRVAGRRFLFWFRRNFEPGDEVTLEVIGPEGERREVVYEPKITIQ